MKSESDSNPHQGNVRVCQPPGSDHRCSSALAAALWTGRRCVQVTRPGGEEGSGGPGVELLVRGRFRGRSPSFAVTHPPRLEPAWTGICRAGGPATGTSPPRNLSHLSA